MKIQVTAEHISKGRKHINHGKLCPVGRALIAAGLPVEHFYWDGRVFLREFRVPENIMRKIRDIANGKPVKPFTFEI